MYQKKIDRGAFGILRDQLSFWMDVRKQQTVGAIVYAIESGYFGLIEKISMELFKRHKRFDRVNQEVGLLTIEVARLVKYISRIKRDPINPRREITEARALIESFKQRRGINFDEEEQRLATAQFV
jgi:hypothetical protein